MRNTVRQRFALRVVIVLALFAALSARAADPAIDFESNTAKFSGFTPNGDIAVVAVAIDAYPEVDFRRIVTRQFLLTADGAGNATFALELSNDPEMEYRDLEIDAMWAAVDVSSGKHKVQGRGRAALLDPLPAGDVTLLRNQGTTDEIHTELPVAVLMVRPNALALFNDATQAGGIPIPLDDTSDPEPEADMTPAKKVWQPVSRFQTNDVVIAIDRAALRSWFTKVQ